MPLQERIKTLIGTTAASRPLRPVLRRLFRSQANIVYYHFAGETAPYYKAFSGGCSIARLNRDLELLKSHFRLAALSEVLALNRSGRPPEQPVLAVTFDDGFNLIRSGAMEVLDRHSVNATVFLITSCIGNTNLMWRNKLSAILHEAGEAVLLDAYNALAAQERFAPANSGKEVLAGSMTWPMASKDPWADRMWERSGLPTLRDYLDLHRPYMGWEDLEAWRRQGHTIGLHTATHPACASLDVAEIETEIVRPAALLRERLALDAVPFSYPFGIRLPEPVERNLIEDGTIECALGIRGSVHLGASPARLERTGVEGGVHFPLYGKHLIRSLAPR